MGKLKSKIELEETSCEFQMLNKLGASSDPENDLLMIPGPVRIHPRIARAMQTPIFGHRTNPFRNLYLKTVEMFKSYLKTECDLFLLAGSGTSALETGIANFVARGTKVLSFSYGKFSERAGDIAKAFGADVHVVEIEWGQPVTGNDVEKALSDHPDTTLVTVCHNETCTGVLSPIKEIGDVCRKYDVLLAVDGVTSVFGTYVCPEEQNIDILASGSQKSWGLPPGLAMIAVGPRAWERINESRSTYYFDLKKYKKSHGSGDTPYTPAITLIYGLYEALTMYLEETEEKRSKRHAWCAELIRTGVSALGLSLLSKEGFHSPVVTAIRLPDNIKPGELRKLTESMGVQISGAQAKLKSNHIRIASMNFVQERDILTTFSVLEVALKKLGYSFELGKSVTAIQEKILNNSK
jgi:aspartate aminotransferase-like enzyme